MAKFLRNALFPEWIPGKAQFLPLEAIKNPIKMVIYMGNHENLVEETST
ncbi:MAG: hypothetical protein U0043_00285 [Streptococcus sp.]